MTAIPAQLIKNVLSETRLATFEDAITPVCPWSPLNSALALYAWNARISGAMLPPLHICEVVVRNAVSDAISAIYGPQWPWNPAFAGSLPNKGKFKMRDHLESKRYLLTTGKIIPELAFNFWQKMFTERFDLQIWNAELFKTMPHLDATWTVQHARGRIHNDLETIRRLRNRIAHHEPIFTRNLAHDFQQIKELIGFRCPHAAAWMLSQEQVTPLFAVKPS